MYPNGTLRWDFPDSILSVGYQFESAPTVHRDGNVYLFTSDGILRVVFPNGTLAWTFNASSILLGTPSRPGPPTVTDDGTAYAIAFLASSGNSVVLAVSPPSAGVGVGTLKWTFVVPPSVFPAFGNVPSPSIAGDVVVAGLFNGGLYRLNISTGLPISGYLTGGPINSQPAIGPDGVAYFGSEDKKARVFCSRSRCRWCVAGYPSPASGHASLSVKEVASASDQLEVFCTIRTRSESKQTGSQPGSKSLASY